ncbi:hypothetical protein SDC9_88416 [bioreactor metagenome]|uniref:Uncharacterized protein n=1 Tax=bioreactor metagenome TaxID=1076179 RepID=A0A644ZM07_9ZZZZ
MAGDRLVAKAEGDACVHHCLTFHHVREILRGDGGVREHVQVRQPPDDGTGLFPPVGWLAVESADIFALFKVERVLFPVPPDRHVHVLGGVLGCAGTQAVQAQGVFVIIAAVVVIFAAGVQFAEYQLPVPALLLFVPVQRTAPAQVLHLNGAVQVPGDGDEGAVALPGLVNGVGENFKHRVLAALQPIGTENNAGPLPHPVRAFQRGNALVAIVFFYCHCPFPFRIVSHIGNIVSYSAKNFKAEPDAEISSVPVTKFLRECSCAKFYIINLSPRQSTFNSGFYTFSTEFSTLLCKHKKPRKIRSRFSAFESGNGGRRSLLRRPLFF